MTNRKKKIINSNQIFGKEIMADLKLLIYYIYFWSDKLVKSFVLFLFVLTSFTRSNV